MYNRLFILLIQVGHLGIDVSPTSLPQWSTLLFLLIFIMYKYITPNTIYYHSHTFSLMIYNFIIMYMAWCLTLYHNPIYCWALSIYNYFNFYQYHTNVAIHYFHTPVPLPPDVSCICNGEYICVHVLQVAYQHDYVGQCRSSVIHTSSRVLETGLHWLVWRLGGGSKILPFFEGA